MEECLGPVWRRGVGTGVAPPRMAGMSELGCCRAYSLQKAEMCRKRKMWWCWECVTGENNQSSAECKGWLDKMWGPEGLYHSSVWNRRGESRCAGNGEDAVEGTGGGGLFPATTSTLLPSFFLIHTINFSPTCSLFMAFFSSSSSHLFPYLILHSTFPNRFYHLQPLLPVLPSYLSSADPCFAYLLIMSKTLKPQNIGLRLF